MSPACMPVTRDPSAVTTDPGGGTRPCSRMWSTSGSRTTRKPSTLARIQPGRSTTATRPISSALDIPVTCRTGSATAAASSCSSLTTALASARLTCGPGLTHRTPVEIASSQSIICPLLTTTRYDPGPAPGDTAMPAGSPSPAATARPAAATARSQAAEARSAAAAARQGRRHRVDRARRADQFAALGDLVGHEGEGQDVAAGIGSDPGQARHLAQVAGLAPDHAERGRPEAAEHALPGGEGAGETGHRHAGDGGPQRRWPAG